MGYWPSSISRLHSNVVRLSWPCSALFPQASYPEYRASPVKGQRINSKGVFYNQSLNFE